MLWWQRDRIRWRHIFPLIPFFVVGVALGLTTVWLEKYHVGAQGEEWALSFVDRVLVAGRALWFYAGKLVWPYELTFIYPRWQIDAGAWWQYLFPLAAVAVIFILWLLRQRLGKGPLVAVLFFAGTLFPALGFFDVYPMRFSFVADHFQYLASIGLISLFSASISIFFIRLGSSYRNLGFVACFGALLALGLGVWKQGSIYRDAEMLYRDTIAKNPNAWMAHNNLGVLLEQDGSVATAMTHYATALRIKPDYAIAHLNIAEVLALQGKFDEAIAHSLEALRLKPDYPAPHNSLGLFYARQGKIDEAVAHFSQALRMKPDYANPHNNLGALLARQGKLDEAIAHFSEALRILPDYAKAHNNLGETLARQGKVEEAIFHYTQALQINPEYADAYNNLGSLLAGEGNLNEALEHYTEALRIKPDLVEAHNNMGVILARQGKFEEAIDHFSRALEIQPDSSMARKYLDRVMEEVAKKGKKVYLTP
jgi:tetratricopeptide (TPR) repeat protein